MNLLKILCFMGIHRYDLAATFGDLVIDGHLKQWEPSVNGYQCRFCLLRKIKKIGWFWGCSYGAWKEAIDWRIKNATP